MATKMLTPKTKDGRTLANLVAQVLESYGITGYKKLYRNQYAGTTNQRLKFYGLKAPAQVTLRRLGTVEKWLMEFLPTSHVIWVSQSSVRETSLCLAGKLVEGKALEQMAFAVDLLVARRKKKQKSA